MKNNLFFVAYDYDMSKNVAKIVAEFFAMRLFDAIEMFEFNNVPRKLDDVLAECGRGYVEKKMKSIVKMEFDFDDAAFVAPFEYFGAWSVLCDKIKEHNLVIFLNDKTMKNISEEKQINKLKFLSECCDIAVEISDLSIEDIANKVINEIKQFFNLEE